MVTAGSTLLTVFDKRSLTKRLRRDTYATLRAMRVRKKRLFRRESPRLFVIRANRDEAILSLLGVAVAGRIGKFLSVVNIHLVNGFLRVGKILLGLAGVALNLLFLAGIAMTVAACVLGVFGIHVPTFPEDKPAAAAPANEPDATTLWVRGFPAMFCVLFLLVLVGMVFLNVVSGLLLTPFGIELYRVGTRLSTKANVCPTGVPSRLLIVPDEEMPGRIRHSVYLSRYAQAAIAEWVLALEPTRPAI